MKICHNCGRELENTIKNCIRCNEEQLNDAVIFKAQPKPPPEVKSRSTNKPNAPIEQQPQTNPQVTQAPPTAPTTPAQKKAPPPYVQQVVKDDSGLINSNDSNDATNENNLDTTTTTQSAPSTPSTPTTPSTPNDTNVDEILDDIISEEMDREQEKQQNSTNISLLVLLVLVFVIIIVIVQPYIKEAISPTKPVYSNVTSIAPVTDTTEIVTQIVEHENDVNDDVIINDNVVINDNSVLEGSVAEQFPEFEYINKTIHELNEFYDDLSDGEDDQSTQSILGNDYLVQISTDTDYVITNVNYTSSYNATAETLNESISKINQISDFFTQDSQATPIGLIGIPMQNISQLSLENLTQEGFVAETFKSSYAIDDNNMVTITIVCNIADGIYTLTNSIDFELVEILPEDNVESNVIILNDGIPTESPYTQTNIITLTSM